MKKKHAALAAAGLLILAAGSLALQSCKSMKPAGAVPVQSFDASKYLGTWHEIARFDYKFERGLEQVTANYSLKKNGDIRVENKGYKVAEGKWKSAIGIAKFREGKDVAALKVSFFGPFYAGYNVVAIDPGYHYALVAGESLEYLWLLSREKTMPENVKQDYLQKAKAIGYDVDKLIWVKQ